ncbi:MAG: hypothetical protein PHF51_03120 [Candidatus ainarchaeum sp.]|nr:hypothetical protein [Candidatus ainarchaeum sp.]
MEKALKYGETAGFPKILEEGLRARTGKMPASSEEAASRAKGMERGVYALFRTRKRLQEKKRAALEKLWGEPAAAVIFHAHTCGASNGYRGSPDGVLSISMDSEKDAGRPWLPKFLKSIRCDAAFISDHDACGKEQMAKLGEAAARVSGMPGYPSLFAGTELSSADGHILVLPRGKPLENVPPPGTPSLEIAEWAFKNGHDVLIPHPNRPKMDPRRMAMAAFGIDISLERECVDAILALAEKFDRIVYVACANGTTLTDYRANLIRKKENGREPEIFARRAAWIAEADGHIACEYPSNVVYFRKSLVAGADGKVSAEKIAEAVARQKKEEYEAYLRHETVPEKDRLFVSYASEKDFGARERLLYARYFVAEYSRLAIVWARELARGQKPSGFEARKPEKELSRVMRYEAEEGK